MRDRRDWLWGFRCWLLRPMTLTVWDARYQVGCDIHHIQRMIMTLQEKVDAITTAIDTATTGIKADIQTLKDTIANGQTADFTALDAKVAALAALNAENPAPPTPVTTSSKKK